jgi:hypothetical protein
VIGATFRFAYFVASCFRFSIDTSLGSELADAPIPGDTPSHEVVKRPLPEPQAFFPAQSLHLLGFMGGEGPHV